MMGSWAVQGSNRLRNSCVSSSNMRTEMEYKYVVRNNDGEVAVWKPGDNFSFQLPDVEEAQLPEKVRINDAWDGSYRTIEVPTISRSLTSVTHTNYIPPFPVPHHPPCCFQQRNVCCADGAEKCNR